MVLDKKKYFSHLDLKNGFFHATMEENSVKYTFFVTSLGQYKYLKMPFGLKVGPAKFQRFIQKVFKELIEKGDIVIYLDDILVVSESLEYHFQILKLVFKLLTRNHLQLRINKCKFLCQKIEYLGYIITKEGIKPTDNGLTAITDFPIPRNTWDVHSFVGLCSYFRKFVENFAVLIKPLNDLLKKGATFKFGPEELAAFETVKMKLISGPVLAIYNPKDETELHCYTSSIGYGAILMQP